MLIPNYFPLTADQFAQLQAADEDTAVDLAMEWMEEETTGEGTDIDKSVDELAAGLTDPAARAAVIGHTRLCEDPALYIASPQQTVTLAQALTEANVAEDMKLNRDTLVEFYTSAVEHGHATAILYN